MGGRLRRIIAIGALTVATLMTLAQSQFGLRSWVSFDFITRYAAGEVTAQGDSPYDDEVLFPQERSLGARLLLPMYDAPPVAAAFRVFSILPLRLASLVLGLLGLASCVILVRASVGDSSRSLLALGTVAMLVFSPARHTLHLGQIDLVVMASVVLLGRWQPALAIAKPQTAGLTALALFAEHVHRRPGRALLEAGAGALVLVVMSALLARSATWADWIDHLGDRTEGADRSWLLLLAAAAGGAVMARAWVLRGRAAGPLDLMLAAGAATGLLAVMGGWNPQWFLAQALPLGALLVAARTGTSTMQRHHRALLIVACGLAAGDSYVALSFNFRLWVPVAILGCLLVALVALRDVPLRAAAAVLVVSLAIHAIPLSKGDRAVVPMVVSVILLYLVLELRPQRAGGRPASRSGDVPA